METKTVELIDLKNWVELYKFDEKEYILDFAMIHRNKYTTDLIEQRKRLSLYRDLKKLKNYIRSFFENEGNTFVTAKLGNVELKTILPILESLENNWFLEGNDQTWGIVENYGNPNKWDYL